MAAEAVAAERGAAGRGLRRVVEIRPGEGALIAWAGLYIFALMTAYYVLRPIRDAMGVEGGIENLPWLFTATLVAMIALNPFYAALVRGLPSRSLIPVVYLFFIANLGLFGAAAHVANPEQLVWVGRAFFIWLSVFNLFVVSVFWTLMVDLFDPGQAKRLFGFLSAAATLGATLGSTIAATLAKALSTAAMMTVAAALLLVAVGCVARIVRLARDMPSRTADLERETIGGGLWAGLTRVARSPYLVNIGLYILFYTVTSTFLYFQQAEIAKNAFADRGARTAFFASVDLAVNVLTLFVQVFLTSGILRRFGVAKAAAALPLLTLVGFAVLAIAPTIAAIVVFQVLRRVGNFGLAKPTRELMFTVLPREDKYKAKNVVDTVVYRLGDQVGSWSYALLAAFGLGVAGVALAALPVAAAWLVNGYWLGARQEAMAHAARSTAPDQAPEKRT
ncbi:NTP/NDP exchange transporter [Hansschlegelia plantiphila]|uniref:MFS transporter n=1 Tax=Hansschlegelia plantiphila TaxID=374655 RepID=A0A9W6MX27_9HYPH|nr:Npt1/Npt2 family nucleotide transporter [Hansschlegelia plantiphila]GLK69643.1 MFS transporter [Hansschlegelia plantiphila]